MANARVRRGRKTQDLIAERWVQMGLFPEAEAVPASLPGVDIRKTPGYSVEVKARKNFDPVAALRQATTNTMVGDIPVVIVRPNGLGPASMNRWIVCLYLQDFEYLVAVDRYEESQVILGDFKVSTESSNGQG